MLIKFPIRKRVDFPVHEALIAQLEELLERARDGQLQGMGAALVWRDDLSIAGLVTCDWFAPQGTSYAMSHAIDRLHRRWGDHCDDLSVEATETLKPIG